MRDEGLSSVTLPSVPNYTPRRRLDRNRIAEQVLGAAPFILHCRTTKLTLTTTRSRKVVTVTEYIPTGIYSIFMLQFCQIRYDSSR